ncbi:MAG: hypothetical protein ABSB61_02765 [Anaerolineales bacterium]|jgi:hypothetical protein
MNPEKNVTIEPPRPKTWPDHEGISVNANASGPSDVPLFNDMIASADMLSAEVGPRNLHLHDDPDKGIQIWDGSLSERMGAPITC